MTPPAPPAATLLPGDPPNPVLSPLPFDPASEVLASPAPPPTTTGARPALALAGSPPLPVPPVAGLAALASALPSLRVVLPLQPLTAIQQATSEIGRTHPTAARLPLRIEFMTNATLSLCSRAVPSG